MSFSEKGTVEDHLVEELQSHGLKWKYVEPQMMHDRRNHDFEQSLVVNNLKAALRRVNDCFELTEADLDFVITSLRTIPATIEGIRVFLDRLRNGFVVPLQKEGKEQVIRLIDFKNLDRNDFVVTNQFKVDGSRGNIRADIVLLVNGIPLVLIECKNPTAEAISWFDGYKQIKRYEQDVPELFKYVQFSIATDSIKTYYFPNSYSEENKDFLGEWKDPSPFDFIAKDDLKITVYGLLCKQHVLDLIENFVFVRKEMDKSSKIMARYMQFRAANSIFSRVKGTLTKKGNERNGLVWHWQGSGKTYTMAFSAWKIFNCPEIMKPSIFVMVDRKDLEEQIEKDFSFIEIPIEKVNSIKELIEILQWGREGKRGIFLVTIEKFSPKEFLELEKTGKKLEIERENVIVLADEVHRTQYGEFATLARSVFKNAFIFGFTGTPLSKAERNTFKWFCPEKELYLDRYSMLDALQDGFTVPLCYEAKLPEHQLKKEDLERLLVFEEEEIQTLSSEEQRALRQKISLVKTYMKKPDRIKAISENIAQHFKDMVEPTQLKALLVTVDREACVQYKNQLDQYLPQECSEIVMTFTPNDKTIVRDYYDELKKKYKTADIKEMHRTIIGNFKQKPQPKILIVTDMLITGFDAPSLWTMYLDKPLKEHRLLQAIARTNRPFSNKKFGLIVDYVGILPQLEKAFEKFEASDAKALKIVIRKLDEEKEQFKQLLNKALQIFSTIKRTDTRENLNNALDLLIDPDTAKRFEETIRELMRSYEMLSGDPFLKPYLLDYKWLIEIYVAYYKRFKRKDVDELKIDDLSKKTIKLIQQTIDVKRIDETYPTVTIDEEYIKILKKSIPKTRGAAIDVFGPVIVEIRRHPNSPFFINLTKEVERTFEELRNRKIETTKAIQKIIEVSRRILDWKAEEKEVGKEKYPLYEAIAIVIPKTEKQRTIAFVNKFLKQLENKKLLFKDWQLQRDITRKVKAETRLMVLSEFKDYKNKTDELAESIFTALEGMKQ